MNQPTVTRSIEVAASPQAVYALITDLAVLAELADETTSMSWKKGTSVVPGSVFVGSNANGRKRWRTICTVTDAEPGSTFAFEVKVSLPPAPVSRWQYDIRPVQGGCLVTESTWDRRPAWFRTPARLATGVKDRTAASAEHIEATLDRLKSRAESPHTEPPHTEPPHTEPPHTEPPH